jgi:hypothetical protein
MSHSFPPRSPQLQVIFVVVTFSAGMPVVYLGAAISFLLAYWGDKYMLLRLCRQPVGPPAARGVRLGVRWQCAQRVCFSPAKPRQALPSPASEVIHCLACCTPTSAAPSLRSFLAGGLRGRAAL